MTANRRRGQACILIASVVLLLLLAAWGPVQAQDRSRQVIPRSLPASSQSGGARIHQSAAPGEQILPRKQVLILHSYHPGYKWTDDIMKGILSVLSEEVATVDWRVEYLDTKRILDAEYLQMIYDLYRYKFRGEQFDVIIASDNDAFNFLLAHRDALFPGVPVVFCGVNYFEDSQLGGQTGFTGVNETVDLRGTLDLALRLHPQTRQIVVVNDTTTTGVRLHEKLMEIVPAYQDKVRFIFLEDVEMSQIEAFVTGLRPDSLVFYTLFFKDKAGRFFQYDESTARVAAASRVPVYGAWDFSLGHGIVGGSLASGYYQGQTAAQLALRILRGEKVENVPIVMESPNRYMFDHTELERFDIPLDALPKGSIVINRPVTFYEEHGQLIWIVAVVIVGAAAVVWLVLTRNVQLREMQATLQVRNRELADAKTFMEEQNERLQSAVRRYAAYMSEVMQGNLDATLSLEEEGRGEDDAIARMGIALRDMMTTLRAMIERERAQRELIEAQQQAIQELSTPIIPIMDVPGQGGIVVVPLIGAVDSARARDITRRLLAGVREHQASVAIIDITGVPLVDSGVANHLNKTIRAVRLKGVHVIITGISDAVAETIVDLGIDWSNIETLRDLQMGLVAALRRLGIELASLQVQRPSGGTGAGSSETEL